MCAAINESPKTDAAIKDSWDRLGQLGLLPAEAIAPFRGHELEDEASGHAEISGLVFRDHSIISGAQQRRIRAHVRSFIATQQGCYEALKAYYREPQGPALWSPSGLN